MNPHFLMAALFTMLAGLMAVDVGLVQAGQQPAFAGIRWLRVHLITLGIATELLFGLLPGLVRGGASAPRAGTSWGQFLLLNGGILALLVGIPSVNQWVTYAGGTMVFLATAMLIGELTQAQTGAAPSAGGRPTGQWFYVTGLVMFLFGITVGTGLLFNWATPLRIKVPIEVHVHANSWGLVSLAVAGLLVDLMPRWSGRELAWPGSLRAIYWLMTLGATGLVLGPWLGSTLVTVPGLLMHLASTLWLLANVVVALRGTRLLAEPGVWHIVIGYVWMLAPVAFAPFVVLAVPGFPGAAVEANAPQALVYGWVLQVAVAVLPFALRREQQPGREARLGGSWITLAALHGGSLLLWTGIFLGDQQATLHAAAYGLWALALALTAIEVWGILRAPAGEVVARPESAAAGQASPAARTAARGSR